ncbi:hypothetical protein ACJW30_05G111300 [Castanea mollissima]
MAGNSGTNGNDAVALNVNHEPPAFASKPNHESGLRVSITFMQKVSTPRLLPIDCRGGGYILLDICGLCCGGGEFGQGQGCDYARNCHSLGSGRDGSGLLCWPHLNEHPAVTIAFATCKRFPTKQVPAYIAAQFLGSTLASGTLRLLFQGQQNRFAGTLPAGSNMQSFVIEFIITFYLMFVISGVATDNRAIGELAGLAVGSTVLLNVMFSGPITGASMNPARSLGPAIVHSEYRGIWIYMVAPILGAISGAWVYNVIRYSDNSVLEITKSGFKLKESENNTI